MKYKILGILLLLIILKSKSSAQNNSWNFEIHAGVNIQLNRSLDKLFKPKQKFVGNSIFISSILNTQLNSNFTVNYGSSIAFYRKSLGNSRNTLVSDFQIDFINSFSIGYGVDSLNYTKYTRTVGNSQQYDLKHNYKNAVFLTTGFILNNNKRNQAVGGILINYDNFSIVYHNDGGIPINWLPISDNFDRWWTSGLCFYQHDEESFNKLEFRYDQFTGYSPLIYELSSLFGINVPKYRNSNSQTSSSKSFNSSLYGLRISLNKYYALDFGINGNLRFDIGKEENSRKYHFSLQDIIHILQGSALHPNKDSNRFYYGFTTNQFLYETRF